METTVRIRDNVDFVPRFLHIKCRTHFKDAGISVYEPVRVKCDKIFKTILKLQKNEAQVQTRPLFRNESA